MESVGTGWDHGVVDEGGGKGAGGGGAEENFECDDWGDWETVVKGQQTEGIDPQFHH